MNVRTYKNGNYSLTALQFERIHTRVSYITCTINIIYAGVCARE